MARKLKDDEIKWILDLDAKGVQGEINKLSGKIRELDIEYEKAKLLLKLDYAQQYVNQVGEFVQAGSDLVKSIEEAETANTQAQYAERHTALKKQLDDSIISQEEYNVQKEKLDYEQRVAELEVQKKYADANFAIQVAQIGVATATGIINAWASSMTLSDMHPL